ncbi:MAG: hypothetical protein IKL10_10785 [Clostridia bacterium]|nr:hypothetical protein [Clostridia bacterium]
MANQKTPPTPVKAPAEKFMLYPTKLFNATDDEIITDGSSAVASHTYLRGLVMGTCDKFGHPVVILQRNNNTENCARCENCGKDENTAFCGDGKFLRLESTLFYDHWAKVCKKIRDKGGKTQCCQRDEIIADLLLNNLNREAIDTEGFNLTGVKIKTCATKFDGKNSHLCVHYECPISHYDEIAVNINVNGIEGVLIIGQLLFSDTSVEQVNEFKENSKELGYRDEEIKLLIESAKVKRKNFVNKNASSKMSKKKLNEALTVEEIISEIFECVEKLEAALEREYTHRIDNNVKNLQEKMINSFNASYCVPEKNDKYNISKVKKCEEQYKLLRAAFYSSLKVFCAATDTVTELYSLMPKGLYFNSPNVLGRIKTDSTYYDAMFLSSVLINEFDVFTEIGREYSGICKKLDVTEEKYIKIIIKITKTDEAINRIFNGFLQFVSLYITELFAQYNGAQISEYTKMMRHEMGQLNEAILIRINTFQEAVGKQDEDYYTYNFLSECNHVIEDFKAHAHSTMLRCNSSRYFNQLPDMHKELFYPYESFLYKWRYIYERAARNKHVNFNMEPVQFFDLSRPRMYADKSMIEQVAYNLTNNAIKYSIPGTTISIDCRLNEQKDAYQLIVTNYGRQLREEEINSIFDYGFRGSNNNEANGSGLGLFLSKEIANAHNGNLTVETEKISDYDVSCLYLYSEMPEKFQNREIRKAIEEELNRLKESKFSYDFEIPKLNNQSFTPYLIKRYLNTGTMKYKFILSIPYEKN